MKYLKTFESQNEYQYITEYKEVKKISEEYDIEFGILTEMNYELIPYFKKIIDSHNLTDILKTIDLLPKGISISDAQFLFQMKYRIEIEKSIKDNPTVSYFDDVKNKILEICYNITEQEKKVRAIDNKARVYINHISTSNDVSILSRSCGALGNLPSAYKIYNKLSKLNQYDD